MLNEREMARIAATKEAPAWVFPLKLSKGLERLHELHSDMTIQQAMAMLWIASNEGVTQREATGSLGFTESSTSRILALLSEYGSRTITGLGLIRSEINPEDRRERFIFLTSKGRRLVEDIERDIKDY